MKLYPWNEVCITVDKIIKGGANCYQQWNCEHCGAKQTMENANVFSVFGNCEECKKITNIKKNGMNYMVVATSPKGIDTLLKHRKGEL
jgi:hypothetical protein